VLGTSWHGVFENDVLRRSWLTEAADRAGRDFTVSPTLEFAQIREDFYERAADLIDEYLDVDALQDIARWRRP
jgi:adenosylcobyric acid synthase